MSDERRKDYSELTEIRVMLATVTTELKNVAVALNKHVDDDDKREIRISGLEKREQFLLGKIAVVCGILMIAAYKIKVW